MVAVTLKLQPLVVPTHVTLLLPEGRQDIMQAAPQIHLKDLPDDVLAALIEEFAANVMKIARPD